MQLDAPQDNLGAGLIVDRDRLLVDGAGVDAADLLRLAQGAGVGVGRMFADQETTTPLLPAAENRAGAEVAIRKPQLPGSGCGQQRSHQRALLGVTILTGNQVGDHPQVRIVDHQGLPRQRGTRETTQWLQALLARSQMIAVQDPQLKAGHADLRLGRERPQHRAEPLRAACYQGAYHRRLGPIDLVVERGNRNRQRPLGDRRLGRRMQRRAQTHGDQRHQVHRGRKQQLPRVLPLAVLLKQGIEPLRLQRPFQPQARHDRDWTTLDEPLHDPIQCHVEPSRHWLMAKV